MVESDALQINLKRFNLFFPERRDFFLERADLFEFGLRREAEVFFSRRIGIRGRREVPIIAGARTYGQVGDTNLGLMTMQTASVDSVELPPGGAPPGTPGLEAIPTENFTVARVKQNVLGRSYVGGIVTARNGDMTRDDTTVGGDFQFLFGVNSRVVGRSGAQQPARSGPGQLVRQRLCLPKLRSLRLARAIHRHRRELLARRSASFAGRTSADSKPTRPLQAADPAGAACARSPPVSSTSASRTTRGHARDPDLPSRRRDHLPVRRRGHVAVTSTPSSTCRWASRWRRG